MSEPASPSRSLRRNFSWSLVGQLVFAATQWGIVMAISKIGEPEVADARLGQFALGLAIAAPMLLLTSLQLRPLLAADFIRRFRFRDYVTVRAAGMAVMLPTCILIASFQRAEVRGIIIVICLAKAIEGLGDIVHGHFQRDEQLRRIALSQMMRGILALGVFTTLLWTSGQLLMAVCGMAASWAAVFLAFDLPLLLRDLARESPRATEQADGSQAWTLGLRAMPLGLVGGLAAFHLNLPRYWLEAVGAERSLGLFAGIGYIIVVSQLLSQALVQATTPRFGRYWRENDMPSFRRLLVRSLALVSGIGLGTLLVAAVLGRPLLALLYNPGFSDHVSALMWMCLVGLISGLTVVLRTAMTSTDNLWAQIPMVVVAIMITAVVAWGTVSTDPLHGAIYSLLAGRVAQCLFAAVVVFGLVRAGGRSPSLQA